MTRQSIEHNWAHKVEAVYKYQHTQGNLFYVDSTIYSYGKHFPIASHYTSEAGKDAILFTTRGYSMTTSKHIRQVQSAIPRNIPIIYCYNPEVRGWNKLEHLENKSHYEKEAIRLNNALVLCRKGTKKEAGLLSELNKIELNARAYCDFFVIDPVPMEKMTDSKRVEIILFDKALKARAKEQEKERAIEATLSNAEKIAQWLANERNSLPYDCPLILRVNDDNVESSKGASVTVEEAKNALPYLLKKIKEVETGKQSHKIATGERCTYSINCEGLNYKIGAFQLLSIDCENTTIGCHVIPNGELIKLADTLGVSHV